MTPDGYLLALHRRLNLTRPRFERLTDFFKSDWRSAYRANSKDWQQAGVDKRGLEKFFSSKELYSPAGEAELLQACGAKMLSCEEALYPDFWHHLTPSPAIVFYKGIGENLQRQSLAVVGARKISDYGEHTLNRLLKPVLQNPLVLVSGLAYGVDAKAHILALEHNCPTIAVLGNGIDDVYPQHHTRLAEKILEAGGTLVSEYLPRTQARPEHFPQRNRLLVGLAEATVVIEARVRSGSLVSARLANDMGKEVWAVPGDITRPNSVGCNQLLFQGEARALVRSEDLMETLHLKSKKPWQKLNFSAPEKEIISFLKGIGSVPVAVLHEETALSSHQLAESLLNLELNGVIKQSGLHIHLCQ